MIRKDTEAIASRSFDSLSQRRNNFEEIADDAVVGYLKDWRFGILVDRDNALRALHADEVLNRSRDADGEIELWRDSLAGAADLALDGQPAVVADGARCSDFGTECRGQILNDRKIVCFLDAAAHGDDICAEPRSTVCADSRKGSPGLVRICAASMVGVNVVTSAACGLSGLRAKGA